MVKPCSYLTISNTKVRLVVNLIVNLNGVATMVKPEDVETEKMVVELKEKQIAVIIDDNTRLHLSKRGANVGDKTCSEREEKHVQMQKSILMPLKAILV